MAQGWRERLREICTTMKDALLMKDTDPVPESLPVREVAFDYHVSPPRSRLLFTGDLYYSKCPNCDDDTGRTVLRTDVTVMMVKCPVCHYAEVVGRV